MSFFSFVAANLRFLGFGFTLALCSTFGQTFYISMYGDRLREAFELSHGEFGSVYALGTLSSGLLIIWAGQAVDRIDLRIYAPLLSVALALACVTLSMATSVAMLTVAIFMLRICGQGLLSQAATVSMARYFGAGERGRAVSIAALGFPLGQAVFPLASVFVLTWFTWREAWLLSAGALVVLAPLALLWLLKGHGERHASLVARTSTRAGAGEQGDTRQWRRGDVIRDARFGLSMLAMLAPSFIITALNFHQVHLVQTKGWELAFYASGFAVYASFQVGTAVVTGILIDRLGSTRMVPFYMLPLAAACVVLAFVEAQPMLLLFMALAGVSGGMGATLISTVWAELYGVAHLGSIKAMVAGLAVISSALGPAVYGWFIDHGTSIESLSALSGAYAAAASVLLYAVFRTNWLSAQRAGSA